MNARIPTLAFLMVTASSISVGVAEEVEFLRVPNGGIQPQAAVDEHGTLHLVYFQGDSEIGNLFYVTRKPGGSEWSSPIQVNSREGSANRNGAISCAQMAIGKNGLVHVVWFNMHPARYWYTRKESSNPGFEKQRNLVFRYNKGVEAGASVAVDGKGAWMGKEGFLSSGMPETLLMKIGGPSILPAPAMGDRLLPRRKE